MICIYHNKDLDGFCSGAIVLKQYPNAKMIGFDYPEDFPMDSIDPEQHVIMVDVSLPMEQMFELAKRCCYKLTWIDHHVTAIAEYENFNKGFFLNPVLHPGISACEATWKYLYPIESLPTAIKLLGEYDTWRNHDKERWDKAVMPFQYGMRMICSSPETFPSELFDEDYHSVRRIIDIGENILSYQRVQNKKACKNSFETEYEGLRAICLNQGGLNSVAFESVYNPDKHDVMIPFVFNGKSWVFSLYTSKEGIDCSAIAKSKGGGGHKKAAGFHLKELPKEFQPQKQEK